MLVQRGHGRILSGFFKVLGCEFVASDFAVPASSSMDGVLGLEASAIALGDDLTFC